MRKLGEAAVLTSIYFPVSLLAAVDRARGGVSRSAWVRRVIRDALAKEAGQ